MYLASTGLFLTIKPMSSVVKSLAFKIVLLCVRWIGLWIWLRTSRVCRKIWVKWILDGVLRNMDEWVTEVGYDRLIINGKIYYGLLWDMMRMMWSVYDMMWVQTKSNDDILWQHVIIYIIYANVLILLFKQNFITYL